MAIAMPSERDLPPGPLRQLVEALHQLYAEAGRPGTRTLSQAIKANDDLGAVVSHETIAGMLHGKGIPSWVRLDACVRQLAALSPRRPDPDATVLRFHELWCAIPVPTSSPDIPAVPAPPLLEAALRAVRNAPPEAPRHQSPDSVAARQTVRRPPDMDSLDRKLKSLAEQYDAPAQRPRSPAEISAERAAARNRHRPKDSKVRAEDLRRALGPVWRRAMRVPGHGQLINNLAALKDDAPVSAELILEVIHRLAMADDKELLIRLARD